MRSYIFRLPLFTRSIIFVIVLLWVAGMQSVWDVQAWGALIPNEIGLASSMFTFVLFPTDFGNEGTFADRN
jgi:glycosylphosphatidylinositol transamidase